MMMKSIILTRKSFAYKDNWKTLREKNKKQDQEDKGMLKSFQKLESGLQI